MRKAIIFGSNGQDGYYLSEILGNNGVEVTGVSRNNAPVCGDVSDRETVERIVKTIHPDYIFHLAAHSTTAHYALFENHAAISSGTFNILESVKLHSPATRVFLSGSAMQFKNEGHPIDEQSPFEASSPYSVSRIQSVYAGRYYRRAFGLQVYVGYFFNHDSPLRTEKHVNQKIAKAVQRIIQGSTEKLELGNIDVRKEFNYAGDVAAAVWLLVNQSHVYEAVIGSGKAYSIKDWLVYCFNKAGKDWQDFVTIQTGFVPEYQVLVSNPALMMGLGWQPAVDFYQLADMMMEYK